MLKHFRDERRHFKVNGKSCLVLYMHLMIVNIENSSVSTSDFIQFKTYVFEVVCAAVSPICRPPSHTHRERKKKNYHFMWIEEKKAPALTFVCPSKNALKQQNKRTHHVHFAAIVSVPMDLNGISSWLLNVCSFCLLSSVLTEWWNTIEHDTQWAIHSQVWMKNDIQQEPFFVRWLWAPDTVLCLCTGIRLCLCRWNGQ